MKKILYIAKNFSSIGLGGKRRIYGVVNYFNSLEAFNLFFLSENLEVNKFENKIIINTPKILRDRVLIPSESNYKIKKNKLKLFHKGFLYFIPVSTLKIIFKKFDIVYTTVPVFANAQIGYLYKLFHPSTTFIIEYRDFHSLNPSFLKNIQLNISYFFEKIILKKANVVVTTTTGMQNVLSKVVPNNNIVVIKNYISKNDFEDIRNESYFDDSYYHIGYVGSLNVGRDPKELMKLLQMKISDKPIMFHFVGNSIPQEIAIKKILMFNENNNLLFHGLVDRTESLRLMKSFDALYLIINPDMEISNGYGIPGKLFDYIALKNILISSNETFEKIKTEVEFEIISEIFPYKIYHAKENKFLEDELEKRLLNNICF
jgi:hypothetical protein